MAGAGHNAIGKQLGAQRLNVLIRLFVQQIQAMVVLFLLQGLLLPGTQLRRQSVVFQQQFFDFRSGITKQRVHHFGPLDGLTGMYIGQFQGFLLYETDGKSANRWGWGGERGELERTYQFFQIRDFHEHFTRWNGHLASLGGCTSSGSSSGGTHMGWSGCQSHGLLGHGVAAAVGVRQRIGLLCIQKRERCGQEGMARALGAQRHTSSWRRTGTATRRRQRRIIVIGRRMRVVTGAHRLIIAGV